MDVPSEFDRRRFLERAGAIGTALLLAGCASSGDTPTETPSDGTPTETAVPTPTETASPTETATQTPDDDTATREDTATEDEPDVDRPANYRWDMEPGRDDGLRTSLGRFVSEPVGRVVTDHPAFDYSTDSERDTHTIDFEALKLYRDSNFDVIVEHPLDNVPMERIVQSFVDDSIYPKAKEGGFLKESEDGPTSYDAEKWKNADTVEESLDYGHTLLISILYNYVKISTDENVVLIREAYKRYHDFDVLAWKVPMEMGSRLAGMLYSPDDDTVRTYNIGGPWSGHGEAQSHAEIQNWRVIDDPNDLGRDDPDRIQHPVLFHTDEWDRQGIDFKDAKESAVFMVQRIASSATRSVMSEFTPGPRLTTADELVHQGMTTGLAKQLTRTLLEYNQRPEADFEDVWHLANVMEYTEFLDGNYVYDTAKKDDDYTGIFDGDFAVYEITDATALEGGPTIGEFEPDFKGTPIGSATPVSDADDELNDFFRELWWDKEGKFDNFGQIYDSLSAV